MADYSAYFVNEAGHIVGVESIASRTEDEAVIAGPPHLRSTRFSRMEIWDLTQCIAIVNREEPRMAIPH